MSNTPLVTIAIPTYNRAKGYLRQALQCALNQTYPNLDIFVSDNCSADDTEALVAGMNDSRIRYFKHPVNIGANNNFNFCVEQARGEYFLLLHDDDMIDADFVECCVLAANSQPLAGLIRTGTRIIDGRGKVVRNAPNDVAGLPFDQFVLGWFAGKTALYLCSTVFRTRCLQELGGFHSKHHLFQDVMAELKIVSKYGRADICDIKATFRLHEAEMSFASGIQEWCEDSLILLDLIETLATENRTLLRKRGLKFFANGNYYRAGKAKPRWRRIQANLTVLRMYGYRHPPPLIRMLTQTSAYRELASIKSLRTLRSRLRTARSD